MLTVLHVPIISDLVSIGCGDGAWTPPPKKHAAAANTADSLERSVRTRLGATQAIAAAADSSTAAAADSSVAAERDCRTDMPVGMGWPSCY